MKVLVTGGAGFIGSALIRYLINVKGISVINVDSLTYSGNLLSLEEVNHSDLYSFKKIDIIDSEELRFVFGQEQPDAVMHLAAESSVDRSIEKSSEFIQSNIVGTYSLLEETRHYLNQLSGLKREKFRFCHISTDEVFGALGPTIRCLMRKLNITQVLHIQHLKLVQIIWLGLGATPTVFLSLLVIVQTIMVPTNFPKS